MDPWYDYLVLPGALYVIGAQAATLVIPRRRVRVTLAATGLAVMGLIFLAATTLPPLSGEEEYGANIGAGIMLMLIPISALILVVALLLRSRS